MSVSKYTKDELPTWDEMYNCFWLPIVNNYSSMDVIYEDKSIDPYWGILRKKYILAACCNQLNKFLEENHPDDGTKFVLIYQCMDVDSLFESEGAVYEIRKPDQRDGSMFITDKTQKRILVNELPDDELALGYVTDDGWMTVCNYDLYFNNDKVALHVQSDKNSDLDFIKYMKSIMQPVIDYFESKQ